MFKCLATGFLAAALGNLEAATAVAARQAQRQSHCERLEGDGSHGATQKFGQLRGRHFAGEFAQLRLVCSGPGGDGATSFLFGRTSVSRTSGFFGHKNILQVIKEGAHSKAKTFACLQNFGAIPPQKGAHYEDFIEPTTLKWGRIQNLACASGLRSADRGHGTIYIHLLDQSCCRPRIRGLGDAWRYLDPRRLCPR